MQNPFVKHRWKLVAVLLVVLAMTAVDEREKQYRDDAEYCQMVHSKAWPDYAKKYKLLCEDGRVK